MYCTETWISPGDRLVQKVEQAPRTVFCWPSVVPPSFVVEIPSCREVFLHRGAREVIPQGRDPPHGLRRDHPRVRLRRTTAIYTARANLSLVLEGREPGDS